MCEVVSKTLLFKKKHCFPKKPIVFQKKPIVFQHVLFFIPLFWNKKLSLDVHNLACVCFSEESKKRGFTAIMDSRDGSWSNLVTVLGCLKVGATHTLPLYHTIIAESRLDNLFVGPSAMIGSSKAGKLCNVITQRLNFSVYHWLLENEIKLM